MRPSLAAPFALLCAAGGWLTADLASLPYAGGSVGRPSESLLRALLLVVTPAIAAFVGKQVAPGGEPSIPRFFLVPLAGGVINGGIIGIVADFPVGVVGGAIVGLFAGAGFLPFLAPAFAAACSARGRAGSLLAKVERRSVWGASLAGIALGTIVPRLLAHPHNRGAVASEIALASAMLIGTLAIALLDARDLAGLSRLAVRPLVPRTRRPALESFDLGVGEGASEEDLALVPSYRDGGAVREYLGEAALLRGAVQRRLVVDGLTVAGALAAVVVAVLLPTPSPWTLI